MADLLRRLSNVIIVMILSAAIISCTTVLDTDFETSSSGEPWPSGPLPGSPPGDSAEVQGRVISVGSTVSLMSSDLARIDLITGRKPHNTNGYSISFSGVKLTTTDTPVLAIDALDVEERLACGLKISGGEFRLVSGDGEEVIGEYSGAADQHDVIMTLTLGSGTCGVLIEQFEQGAEPGSAQTFPPITANGPIIYEDFEELDRLRFAWENAEEDFATQYFLGNVNIEKGNF